jgi:hypothetical protein
MELKEKLIVVYGFEERIDVHAELLTFSNTKKL